MFLFRGHTTHTDTVAHAIMSEVMAMQSSDVHEGERARAIMSEHMAQQSVRATQMNHMRHRYF